MRSFELMQRVGFATIPFTSTPWDISNAIYENKSFDVSTWEISPSGFYFKSDGTKFYIIGSINDTVFQYSLSTAWDISTASYDNKSYLPSEASSAINISLKSDGTKMYIVYFSLSTTFQYSLSTAWDVSTASYDTKSYSASAQLSVVRGIFFKSDGTKAYMVGSSEDTVFQYSLSTAWDISTASYDNKSYNVTSQSTFTSGLYFKSDGTIMYVSSNTPIGAIYQYDLSTAWDVSTASFTSGDYINVENQGNPSDVFLKSDGTKMFTISTANDDIYQYKL